MSNDYLDYVQPANLDEKAGMAQLQYLAERQARTQSDIAILEASLDAKKRELKQISEVAIPELMDELGVSGFTTATGLKISVRETIRAAIPKNKTEEAIRWLEANGHSSLVKRKVSVNFGKGEDDTAQELLETLNEKHLPFDDSATVHPSTLSAFVREMLADGEDLPLELLGVFRQRVTEVQLP